MNKVVVRCPLPDGWLTPLESVAQLQVLAADATRAQVLSALADAAGFVALLSDRVDAELLAAAPKLQIVANFAVGYNNVDLDAAQHRGIWVTNTPDVLTDATADLTWSLILTVARRIVEAQETLRREREVHWGPTKLLGRSLRGKLLGIVGWGRIGRAVAERAAGFGMRLQYTDLVTPVAVPSLDCAQAVSLAQLVATSDVISLHVPLTMQTRHLLDAAMLQTAQKSTIVINTSRGPVIDESALARALREGRLAGAGLDVFEREPEVCPELWDAPNAVLVPHIGSATVETRRAMALLAAQNVAEVLAGREPPTPVVRGRQRDAAPR